MEDFSKLSISELRSRCQSNAPEAGRDPIIGHSIRFFSIYFTKVFLWLGTTPFMVTVYSVLLFLIGCVLFVFDRMAWNLVGIFIMYISIVFDGCNGEVARLKKYRPDIGSIYIEPVSHDIQYGLMFFPMAIGAYAHTGSMWVIVAGVAAGTAKLLQRFFMSRYSQLVLSEKKQINTEGEAVIPFDPNVGFLHKTYRWFNRNIFSSVGLVIPLLAATLIDRVDYFLYLFAVAFSAFAVLHFWKEIGYIIKIDQPMHELSAVILAGGRGTRLGDLTVETPKPLIQVRGKPIIAYCIGWAKALGAVKTIVAGSHQIAQLEAGVKSIDQSAVIVRDEVEKPGNRVLGVLAAEKHIVGDAVVYDGDYIFHRSIASTIRQKPAAVVTVHASDRQSTYTAQDVLVSYDDDGMLVDLKKTSGTVALGPKEYYFNSLLIIPEACRSEFMRIARQTFEASTGAPVHLEEAVLAYRRAGHAVRVRNLGAPLWMEVDNPTELDAAGAFLDANAGGVPVL